MAALKYVISTGVSLNEAQEFMCQLVVQKLDVVDWVTSVYYFWLPGNTKRTFNLPLSAPWQH